MYRKGSEHSMHETTEYLHQKMNSKEISKKDLQRFIYTLLKAKVLCYSKNDVERSCNVQVSKGG